MTKPKTGRPRRSAALADRRVSVRFTPDEYAEIKLAAGNLPVSDYIRDAAIEAARSSKP